MLCKLFLPQLIEESWRLLRAESRGIWCCWQDSRGQLLGFSASCFPWQRREYYEARCTEMMKLEFVIQIQRIWGGQFHLCKSSGHPVSTNRTEQKHSSHSSSTRVITLKGTCVFSCSCPVVLRVNRINNTSNIASAKWALNELKTD